MCLALATNKLYIFWLSWTSKLYYLLSRITFHVLEVFFFFCSVLSKCIIYSSGKELLILEVSSYFMVTLVCLSLSLGFS